MPSKIERNGQDAKRPISAERVAATLVKRSTEERLREVEERLAELSHQFDLLRRSLIKWKAPIDDIPY